MNKTFAIAALIAASTLGSMLSCATPALAEKPQEYLIYEMTEAYVSSGGGGSEEQSPEEEDEEWLRSLAGR